MAQVFRPSANTIAKVSIILGVFTVGGSIGVLDAVNRSPWATNVGIPIEQTVPFSHKHHVTGLGLDCRYCHTSVEESHFANIPPSKTCINCHKIIWKDAPILQPVRDSIKNETPLEWIRVHDLPDYVYFNHSIHVAQGIACQTCHGQVDKMPLMWKENTLFMSWCLDCHRNPEQFIRPRDQVFNMQYKPAEDQATLGEKLVKLHNVADKKHLTSCSVCHR